MATYPFVKSAVDLGRASGPRLAMAWHMAEGGGTVGYLSRPNPNGVSVHFVVENTGRVVQMLDITHLHSSLRVSAIRGTDDAAYDWASIPVTYGATAASAVMGTWWKNPNNASIGVEVEGFARDGPSTVQRTAIGLLWKDMAARFPGIRSLGHRDFADYKACPGKKFPWDAVGGHGQEDAVSAIKATAKGTIYAYIVRIPNKAVTYGPNEGERGEIVPKADGSPWVGNGLGVYGLDDVGGRPVYLVTDEGKAVYVAVADTAVTTVKWERSLTEPTVQSQKYVVTVNIGGKAVTAGEVTLP